MPFDRRPSDPLPPALEALLRFWSLQQRLGGARTAPSTAMAFALYPRGDGLLLRTPLPGLSADAITLEVEGSTLTLSGVWPEVAPEGTRAQHLERPRGPFRRTLRAPFEIDAERVSARVERGLLEVELPRLRRAAARRITVLGEGARN